MTQEFPTAASIAAGATAPNDSSIDPDSSPESECPQNVATKIGVDVVQLHKGFRAEDPLLVALRMAVIGVRTMPTHPLSKIPCIKRWPEKASADMTTLLDWNQRFNRPNFSVLTGRNNNLAVIDADGLRGIGDVEHLQSELGPLPKTWTSETGREEGGRHYYFKLPPGAEDLRTVGRVMGLSVDIRGHNGHIVLPGSIHKSGKRYRWVEGCAPDECEIAELPAKWFDALPKHETTRTAGRPARNTTPRERANHDPSSLQIGDGDGFGGFQNPVYKLAIKYFFEHGSDASEETIIATLWDLIQAAPKAAGRDIERYAPGGGDLERTVARARQYVIDELAAAADSEDDADPAPKHEDTGSAEADGEKSNSGSGDGGTSPEPEEADNSEKKEDAPPAYEIAIDVLDENSSDEDIEAVLKLIYQAKLSARVLDKVLPKVGARTETKPKTLNAMWRKAIAGADKEAARETTHKKANGKVIFPYNGEYNDDDACKAIVDAIIAENKDAEYPVFSCMGSEVVLLQFTAKGQAKFAELSEKSLRSEVSTLVTFVRRTEQGDGARKMVPLEIAGHLLHQAHKHLQQAPRLLYAPTFIRGPELLKTEGFHYDESDPDRLNHYLSLPPGLDIPDVPLAPTEAQAKASRDWLSLELFHGFPFFDLDADGNKMDPSPSKANAFAMIFLPFMRDMIDGQTPVHFIKKPKAGTGGSLIATLPMLLAMGREAAATVYSDSDDEMSKKLVSSAGVGEPFIYFDNIKVFVSAILLKAITSGIIADRLLGQNGQGSRIEIPNRFVWIADGMKPFINEEMGRRCVFISLDAEKSNIQDRKFRHEKYVEFVLQNRGVAIGHILTVIQYWISQGQKPFTKRSLKSFEDWAEKIGGVLQAVGIEGFLDSPPMATFSQEMLDQSVFVQAVYDEHKNNAEKRNDLFTWAYEKDLAIITGNNDDHKENRFKKTLEQMDGNTFAIKIAETPEAFTYQDHALRSKNGTNGLTYALIAVGKSWIVKKTNEG